MTTTYQELVRQRAELDRQIEEARSQELDAAVKQIRDLMSHYGITVNEIMPAAERAPRARQRVEPKYRDPASGKTWSGRGKPPLWIAGKERSDFLIKHS
ncbi:H-NS histone family protein [Acidovorax sp. LjRoot129]|uniref:H-NS histone family protein n=1 Tax=Acidovorax sp. LjRoot129 TaxID=3342260 RepID=UPI003ED16CD3